MPDVLWNFYKNICYSKSVVDKAQTQISHKNTCCTLVVKMEKIEKGSNHNCFHRYRIFIMGEMAFFALCHKTEVWR